MKKLLDTIYHQQHLTQQQASEVFSALIRGEVSDIEMTSLLIGLKMKGEQPQEIAGAAHALRKYANFFPKTNYPTADSCGTGGSGMNTVNISTMVAIILAEFGLPMVKHGNRSISSKCGSADVLESLGFKIDLTAEQSKQCLDQLNFCFLFAPAYHPGVRHVMPVRNQLQTRTIFNLLGPLINPASPEYQLMGVYEPKLAAPAAESLKLSGCHSAMIVHSSGYDEITLHSPTQIVELDQGKIRCYTVNHTDFDLPKCEQQDIAGQDPIINAQIFSDVIAGKLDNKKTNAIANTVAANAGALLKLANKATSLSNGAELAIQIIQSGKAKKRLADLIELSASFHSINSVDKCNLSNLNAERKND